MGGAPLAFQNVALLHTAALRRAPRSFFASFADVAVTASACGVAPLCACLFNSTPFRAFGRACSPPARPPPPLTLHSQPQLVRALPQLPRLRVLDLSCGARGGVTVRLSAVSRLLAALPAGLVALNLSGWAVLLEGAQRDNVEAEKSPRRASQRLLEGGQSTALTEPLLRARLHARAATIVASSASIAALMPGLAERCPGLRTMSWPSLCRAPGLLPHILLSCPDVAGGMQASLAACLKALPALARLELGTPVDDGGARALAAFFAAASPSPLRCLSLTGGLRFSDAGCAALGGMRCLRVLRLDVAATQRLVAAATGNRATHLASPPMVTASGVAALLRALPRLVCLRVAGVALFTAAAASLEAAIAASPALTALEVTGHSDPPASMRLIRRRAGARMEACPCGARFEGAWAAAEREAATEELMP